MRAAGWTIAGGAAALLLAGCAAPPRAARPVVPSRPFVAPPVADRVMGQNARSLTALFGQPMLDIHQPDARKLQFGGVTCVLDAYLYARKKGQEPVVTHIDTRRSDGDDIDRASCIAALSRR